MPREIPSRCGSQRRVDSPLPPHVAKDESLAAGYRKTLEESMKPVQEKARRAFTVCRDTARDLRIEDDYAKKCEAWLDAHPAP